MNNYNSKLSAFIKDQNLCDHKAIVTHNEINESIATVKKTGLFVSLNRSHCTVILKWVVNTLCQKGQWSFFLQKLKSLQWNLRSFWLQS